MKTPFFLLSAILVSVLSVLSACGSNDKKDVESPKWEYQVVQFPGLNNASNEEYADFHRNLCIVDVDRLNALGSDGWELVGTYSELETKFPNYGDDKYVTGIQSNVRTASIYLIFKRPLVIKEKKDSKGK